MPQLVIRFIQEPGVIGPLIGWSTNSLWCHCEALSRDSNSWTGAHVWTGVQARKLNWCKKVTRERIYSIPVTQANYDAAHDWLEAKIGAVSYNYLGILGLAIHARRLNSDKRAECSEVMTEFLQHGGIWPLNNLPEYDYLITPEILHTSTVFIRHCISQL